MSKLPPLRTKNLVVKELANEILIYDLTNSKAFCLNETAKLIMEECNGESTIEEAKHSVNQKLNSRLTDEMIWLVIEQFKKFDLVAENYRIPFETSRITRRKILHSAAALGIALPIITALVAPTAVDAQSCAGINQPCTSNSNSCCRGSICVNTEAGPTGSQCVACVALGLSCALGSAPCCTGICVNTESGPTGFQCVPTPA